MKKSLLISLIITVQFSFCQDKKTEVVVDKQFGIQLSTILSSGSLGLGYGLGLTFEKGKHKIGLDAIVGKTSIIYILLQEKALNMY